MAYYVGIDMEDKCLIKNIKDSGYFGRDYVYKKKYACTLEEIDAYTARFRDEEFLKRCLLSERIIREDDLDKPLVIMYIDGFLDKKGTMGRKVYGKVLTKKSYDFLHKPYEIVEYIEDRISERDVLFFYELEKILPNDTAIKSVISKISYAVLNLISDGSFSTVGVDFLNEMLLEDKINNYEVYHNIVSFIADYEEYLNKNKEDNKVKTKKQ